jgi:Flp pilus assembly secretin CpaC
MGKQKAVLQEQVRTGELSQESADAEIKSYEQILSEIENGAQVSVNAEYDPDGAGEECITVMPPSDFKVSLSDDGVIISD